MSGHPLPGHRFSQTTRNFSGPAIEEREGLLRNAAPELAAVLIEYEKLEGEMILDGELWNYAHLLPTCYYDRLIDLQIKRNAALKKAGYSFEMRAKAAKGERNET